FTVDVNNGFTAVEGLRVAVNIVPGLIPIQAHNVSIREGSGVALTRDLLNISHPFYASANIDFLVETPPQHGSIRYLDGDEDEISFFTWDEVKQGVIYYLHDSSETTEDSFTLSASVFEIGRRSEHFTIGVTIQPVNDEAPKLIHNTGLELVSGEDAEITANMLYSDDGDTPPEDLVYSIEPPTNGIVALRESPGDSIENFTQAQINHGEVVFVHKGDPSGGFTFTVTDGEHTSPLRHFLVMARQLTISMDSEEEELVVFPGTRQPITSKILKAVTNEDGDDITYAVLRAPRFGRLISAKSKNQFKEISSFTQAEVDSGSIFYEHQMPEDPFWVVRDSVELLLSSGQAQAMDHIVPITVSFYAENHNTSSQLWRNTGLEVPKGQKKVIDSSRLDASNLLSSVPESERATMAVMYQVMQFPVHGTLTLGDLDLPVDNPYFLQEDVGKGELGYSHNGDPEPPNDSFVFRARLNPAGRGPQSLAPSAVVLEETFKINIAGRRREPTPPELMTVDLLLEVLQGSTAVLTPQHLKAVDEDSSPSEILFTVTRGPANGRLVDTETREPIQKFTQDDVNSGRVTFVSDGSLATSFLEFTVSDGRHRTESHSLHIGVLARTLQLALAQEIQVRQGEDETLVTEAMLKASTGGPSEEEVIYTITNIPKYAAVMVDRQPTSAFTQSQIREGRVSVRFVKSTSPRDSVAIVARSRAANASAVLNVTVTPLVKLPKGKPVLPRGTTVLVGPGLLDASPLANKTKAMPTFSVTRQPRNARFVRAGGKEDGQPITAFTQRDLEDGHVAMEIQKDDGAGDGDQADKFEFVLRAHGVPPAEGALPFKTAPYDPSASYGAPILKVPSFDSTLPPSVPTTASASDRGSQRKPSVSRQRNLWAILIPILIILLLLLLAAALAYYLVRKNKTGKHDVQTVAAKPKNGEVKQETFRKTDPANSIQMSSMDAKEPDPELLQHCRTTNPALKKNQYWV
ncbi:hypothetical protein AGOR_G00001650, partial [Albula goreensis]